MYDSMCFGLCLQKVEKLALSVGFSCMYMQCMCLSNSDPGLFSGYGFSG